MSKTVRNRNGAEFDCGDIPDLWHCAEWLREEAERRADQALMARGDDNDLEAHYQETHARVLGRWSDQVLDVWHKAHAMADNLEED